LFVVQFSFPDDQWSIACISSSEMAGSTFDVAVFSRLVYDAAVAACE
jgi:hypothetical protein